MKRILPIFIIACFAFFQSNAQTDTIEGETARTQFKIGVYYNTSLHYYGRTDSLRSSGMFPLAELWFGKGFYINAAPVFVKNEISGFDYAGTVATAGYRFNNAQDKFGGNFFFVKPFYETNSQLVQSALKGQFSSNFTWKNKIIDFTAGGDLKFSEHIDYGATAGLDHIFRIEPGNNVVIVLVPSAYVNAGTQRFSKSYYKKSGFLLFPGIDQQFTEDVNQFKILSYEFSLPIVLARRKFQFIAIPAYVIPQNLVKAENGSEMFYVTMGAKMNF